MTGESGSAKALGAALRGHRMAKGMSLRTLAKKVGLSGHGTLVDYEHGRRIAPEDLLVACEKVLDLDDGTLCRLRLQALAERAGTEAALLLNGGASPAAGPPAVVVARRPWLRRRYLVPAVVVALAVALTGVVLTNHRSAGGSPSSATGGGRLRFDFETPDQRWGIFYGQQETTGEVSDQVHYHGQHAYVVTLKGISAVDGYAAFGTTHGLESLHTGMKVTMHMWTSYPRNGVTLFVRGPDFKEVWAPETPRSGGTEIPVSGGPVWSTITWTVPRVSEVAAIGVQPYSDTRDPHVLAVDDVSW